MCNTKTIFCDIDGTIFKQVNHNEITENSYILLPNVKEQFERWNKLKYCIVLVSARSEEIRETTLIQLEKAGIKFSQLILGIGCENRYLINNNTKNEPFINRAISISVKRDEGFTNIDFSQFEL